MISKVNNPSRKKKSPDRTIGLLNAIFGKPGRPQASGRIKTLDTNEKSDNFRRDVADALKAVFKKYKLPNNALVEFTTVYRKSGGEGLHAVGFQYPAGRISKGIKITTKNKQTEKMLDIKLYLRHMMNQREVLDENIKKVIMTITSSAK